ncbi:odorant receptor 67c-like [Formica exsecta]|uniref:odorant receptor 67c-like n=1 Tax=Formica exsecta TaxID=72781 RepID=UPI00114278FC|nr:odorant receptor 67c-like [Formica exsecta]
MRGQMMLKKIFFFVKLSLFPVLCWPQSKDATRLRMTCVKLYQYFCIILAICLQLPVIYTMTNHLDDFLVLVDLIIGMSANHVLLLYSFISIMYNYLQYVTFEMIDFSELIKPHEDIIIQRYIDKCIILYGASLITFYLASVVVIILPFVMDQPFPLLIEYPFDAHHQPLRTILYIHQVIVGIHVSGQLCSNVFMALLLWFASARFEILTEELRKTTDIYHLAKCIRKHQHLLKYANEAVLAARPFALTTVCCSTICMVILCLLLLTNRSMILVLKCFGLVVSGLSEVFMYTWPAENLIYMSQDVGQAAFDMSWYDQSIEIRNCIQIIMQRSQKPVTIAIPCVMPTLSLNYFASVRRISN